MNVQVTPNYRIKTDSSQFIVEERRIIDPTKAPEHLRKEGAAIPLSMEIREEYRPIAYYGLTPASLESALNCIIIRESIEGAADAQTIGQYIAIIREVCGGIRSDVRDALRAKVGD